MNQIREIDTGTPMTRFARGWHCLGLAENFRDGKPHGIQAFGGKLVVYADSKGDIHVLDGYCRHLGADLAKGSIKGDNVACPFHDWRWNGATGRCAEIPYARRVPKLARTRKWQTLEVNGQLLVWHDPEGGQADYPLPDFAQWDDPSWVNWDIQFLGTLNSHPQEIVDNMADKGHLVPVHGSQDMELFENEFDAHVCKQILKAGHRTLNSGDEGMTNDTWYTGPGILLSTMEGQHPSVIMICNTPVEDGVVRVWYALMVKIANGRADEAGVSMARSYQDVALDAFAQDFELWQHKEPALTILQVPDDGPFHKERIWYRQFYNPRARAKEFQDRVNGIHTSVDKRKAEKAA